MYVAFVCPFILELHDASLYHWYVNVVPHESTAFAVNTIVLHSFPLLLTFLATGATLFHFAVFTVLHVPLH